MSFSGLPISIALWLAAVIAGVLAMFHILRIRPRQVRVVTTLFWMQTIERTQARTFWQRFRHPLTYLLLLAIFWLLLFALTEPAFTSKKQSQRYALIVLDDGVRMSAGAAASRFEAAKTEVYDLAKRLAKDCYVGVLAAGGTVEKLHDFTEPIVLLKQKLSRRTVSPGDGMQRQALIAARQLVGPAGQVFFVTDRSDIPLEPGVQLIPVGEPENNAAIVSAVFAEDEDNPLRGVFRLKVMYKGDKPADVRLTLRRGGGAPLLDQTVTMQNGELRDFSLTDLQADGDELQAAAAADDGWQDDNNLRLRLPLRQPIKVFMDSGIPGVLKRLLESLPGLLWAPDAASADLIVAEDRENLERGKAAIVIVDDGPQTDQAYPVTADTEYPITADLDFEGGLCGQGAVLRQCRQSEKRHKQYEFCQPRCGALPADVRFILSAGAANVAAYQEGPAPRLYLASSLLADDSFASRRAAFAVFISRAVRQLCHWDLEPMIVPAGWPWLEPVWLDAQQTQRTVELCRGGRNLSDLRTIPEGDFPGPSPVSRWGGLRGFEWLTLLALALFILESYLHLRGKIT